MSSTQRPLLIILLTSLSLMLWQTWVQEQKQMNPTPVEGAVAPIELKKPEINTASSTRYQTDVIDVEVSHWGGGITSVGLKEFPQSREDLQPFQMFNNTRRHVYTAQSGFGVDRNLVYNKYSQQPINEDAPGSLVLKAVTDQLELTKRFIFHKGAYVIRVESTVKNISNKPWQGKHSSVFNLMQEFDAQVPSGESGLTIDPNQTKPGWFTFSTFTGPSMYTEDQPYTKLPFADLDKKPVDQPVAAPNWIAMQQRYFIAAWANDSKQQQLVQTQMKSENGKDIRRKSFEFTNSGPSITLAPGEQKTDSSILYAGPEVVSRLKNVARGLELTVDYGWLWFLSDILFNVMSIVHSYLGNWGGAIILTTIIIKLVFYKMTESSYRSMAQQKKLQPRIQAINEQFKDEPDRQRQAIMDLYQKEGVSPLRNGCLSSILPLPFFIALYYVLIESVQLRLAPFLWIPDLSSRDPLYILPLLMGLSMLIQQRLSPQTNDPTQEKAMMVIPLMMTLMFSQFPAGLVLYSVTNNVLSSLQQWAATRRFQDAK